MDDRSPRGGKPHKETEQTPKTVIQENYTKTFLLLFKKGKKQRMEGAQHVPDIRT